MPPKKAKSSEATTKKKNNEPKGKKRKQKVESSEASEEEFKMIESDEDNDFEEEKRIRQKLSSTRLNDGSDFEGDDLSGDETTPAKKKPSKKARKNSDKDTGKKRNASKAEEPKPIVAKKAKPNGPSNFGGIVVKGKTLDAKNDEVSNNLLDHPLDFDVEAQHITEEDAYIPPWAKEPQMQDKNKRYSNDPQYDPTTLYVPEAEFKKLTPVLQQYWKIKQNNFDKLVAMKVWKFYYFYYQDAIIVHKIIDMKLTLQKNWTFTFFHESCLNRFAKQILDQGYQIMVVEQMEEINSNKKDVIRREVCQILTRGTAVDHNPADYSSRFLLAIFEEKLKFGVVFVDTTTHEFYVGEFEDDETRANLRTTVLRMKPVEVIYIKGYLKNDSASLIKFLPEKPTMTSLKEAKPIAMNELFAKFNHYFKSRGEMTQEEPPLPELLRVMKETFESAPNPVIATQNSQEIDETARDAGKPFFFAFQALSMALNYLRSLLLDDTVFSMGQFINFDINLQKQSTLFMDAQALQNLEVLEVNYLTTYTTQNTLLHFMDHTKTAFGKRMFRRWLTSPLMDVDSLIERQNAVQDLISNSDIADYFHDKLSKLPDLERMISRIYNLSNKQRMSAVYFEDFAKNRLKDFLDFLKELKTIEGLVSYFNDYVEKFKCKRLKQLVTFKDVDIASYTKRKVKKPTPSEPPEMGIFPRINDIISDLENMIEFREGVPVPAPGISKENDVIMAQIKKIKENLNNHLEEQRKIFKEKNINYVNSKHRYELEIPEELFETKSRPADFTITSKRKGFLRFHNSFIEDQVYKLYELELEFQKVLVPFIVGYFKKFYDRHSLWNQVIACLGELDCLCSLAHLAQTMRVSCRPKFHKSNEPIFELKEMIHPCLAKSGVNFIPNDINFEKDKNVFLVTGPNMGGKSTLLRMSCIAVIMAQVGSWVPADSFDLTPVDRIFTRIGASDRILEGKSTFFVEMEETLHIVRDATKNSLVIIDELGRGTSTYDGVAIAYAVLKYLAEEIKCFLLFATHYHLLLEEFSLYSNVACYHMACDFDPKKEEVRFLYRFMPGNALSYGINVAKMAGLPIECVMMAKEKSEAMIKEKKNIFSAKNITSKFNNIISALTNTEQNDYDNVEDEIGTLMKALAN